MKPTGIVRRIDDLGRIVIPKGIRRTLHIHEGDPLEIYTGAQGEVIFNKYSPMGERGAVRRIDDLGRIVIPKGIRRTVYIRENDLLEIYIGAQGEVIFKKILP